MLVYNCYKLSHNGITQYKAFEGLNRKMHKNSLDNLRNQQKEQLQTLEKWTSFYNHITNEKSRTIINYKASIQLFENEYQEYLRRTKQKRTFSEQQSKRLTRITNKLIYYSATRTFTSSKSGKYKFKVAFLTLTAPEIATNKQILDAFNHFTDYLRRTANCTYVWKKELGEEGKKFHIHIMINNFIPYYIVSWKWKRLLMAEGVQWPKRDDGTDTDSHYRIELPRNRRQAAAYIAKYMSKVFIMDKDLGALTGNSEVLNNLKEVVLIENEADSEELANTAKCYRVIIKDFIAHCCCDPLRIKGIAPKIWAVFLEQYKEFQKAISLPQKFYYV